MISDGRIVRKDPGNETFIELREPRQEPWVQRRVP
jgi:hypothetical protein